MRFRVVVLDHTADLGGAELALVRLCAAMDRHRVDVHVVLLGHGPLVRRLQAAGVDVSVVPLADDLATIDRHGAARWSLDNVKRASRLAPFAFRLAGHIRRLRPDVLVSNSLKTLFIGSAVAPLVHRPLVWHVHDRIASDYLPAGLAALVRAVARAVPRAVVANSVATARTLPGVRCTVAYPGFAPEQAIASMAERVEPARPVIGLIGRISPTKGQLEFVRAAQQVSSSFPDARFRIVGAPMFGAEAYAAEVRSAIDGSGLAHAVDVVGFSADVESEIDRLTALVHASPVPEPFGQVVVEAMIRGVPVIATRAGGITEILDPTDADSPATGGAPAEERGPLGLLVPPGDHAQLADAIVEVLAHPAAARDRARRAYASATGRFNASRTADSVADLWGAAGRRRRPRAR